MSKRVPGLKELLQAASLDAYIPTADSWCQQAGAVDLSEVLEIEESFADALCLRLLERRRLHKQAEKVVVGDEDFVPSTLRADATGSFYPLKSKKQLEPDRRMCGDNSSSAVTFGCSGSSQATSLSSYYTASRADAHLWPSLHEGTETRKKEAKWNFSGFSHQRVDDRFREHESFLQQQRLKAFKRRSEIEGDEQAERALNLERQARREDGERLHPEQLFVFDKPGFLQPRKRMALPNKLQWRVLGIESSCDDTGAAVLRGDGKILGEALASQAGIHEQWGGVVPRLAQEGHRKAIDETVEEALRRAGAGEETCRPTRVVWPIFCQALHIAAEYRLPLVRVHHMEAHMMVTRLPQSPTPAEGFCGPAFPILTLLVSGGHNMAVLTRGVGQHVILGSTIDDSIGEAFDKTARVLGITQVPGGPHLERLAKDGDPKVHPLPKPLSKTRDKVLLEGCDYSFSGLKTAVRTLVEKELPSSKAAALSEEGN
eukprot:g29890.t1